MDTPTDAARERDGGRNRLSRLSSYVWAGLDAADEESTATWSDKRSPTGSGLTRSPVSRASSPARAHGGRKALVILPHGGELPPGRSASAISLATLD
jgi:hypothetical protein